MTIRIYLKLASKRQDVDLIKQLIEERAAKNNLDLKGVCYYIESDLGRRWSRPELTKLINQSEQGDILLLESISDLTRLTLATWNELKASIDGKGLKIVACDIPISFKLLEKSDDAAHQKVIESVNIMMNEFLEATASKDYDERVKRQRDGIKRSSHKPVGRPSNPDTPLRCHKVYEAVQTDSKSLEVALDSYGVSRATFYRWKKGHKLPKATAKKITPTITEQSKLRDYLPEALEDILLDSAVEDISSRSSELPQVTFANYKEQHPIRMQALREKVQKMKGRGKDVPVEEPKTYSVEEIESLLSDESWNSIVPKN